MDDRFWSKVDRSGDCWVWLAAIRPDGYGAYHADGRMQFAHRYAWEHLIGPIPDGLVTDHLCRNRACVRPSHLELVTNRVNLLRGVGWGGRHSRQTHCVHGHEFAPENTYWWRGHRLCRTCRAAQVRRYNETHRAQNAARERERRRKQKGRD